MTSIVPTPGRLVLYRLDEHDVEMIRERRKRAPSHCFGNEVRVGDEFPMLIVIAWGDTPDSFVNGFVFLDGLGGHWATSVAVGEGPRTYSWMDYQKGQAARTDAAESALGARLGETRKLLAEVEARVAYLAQQPQDALVRAGALHAAIEWSKTGAIRAEPVNIVKAAEAFAGFLRDPVLGVQAGVGIGNRNVAAAEAAAFDTSALGAGSSAAPLGGWGAASGAMATDYHTAGDTLVGFARTVDDAGGGA